jgi:DNA-binding NarL/FixJ family response regulator
LRLIEQHPDLHLILLDVAPDRDGFSALAEVRERYPAISIVVLSGQPDRASVVKAFDLGARGFIPKSVQREVMRNTDGRMGETRMGMEDERRDMFGPPSIALAQ